MCLQPSRRVEALHLLDALVLPDKYKYKYKYTSKYKYKYKYKYTSKHLEALHLRNALVLPDKYKYKYTHTYTFTFTYTSALPSRCSCPAVGAITCMLAHHMYHAYALSRGAITCIIDALVLSWGSVQMRSHGEWSYHVWAPRLFLHTRMLLLLLHLGEEIAVVSKAIPRISRSRQPRGCGHVSPCA